MDLNINNIDSFDSSSLLGNMRSNKIHIRVQQLGRRTLTIIQELDDDLDFKRICKNMRKQFNCNGNVVNDKEMGEIIQLQGDQRDNVKAWLIKHEILTTKDLDRLVIHGY